LNAAVADVAREELERERVNVGHRRPVEDALTLHERGWRTAGRDDGDDRRDERCACPHL